MKIRSLVWGSLLSLLLVACGGGGGGGDGSSTNSGASAGAPADSGSPSTPPTSQSTASFADCMPTSSGVSFEAYDASSWATDKKVKIENHSDSYAGQTVIRVRMSYSDGTGNTWPEGDAYMYADGSALHDLAYIGYAKNSDTINIRMESNPSALIPLDLKSGERHSYSITETRTYPANPAAGTTESLTGQVELEAIEDFTSTGGVSFTGACRLKFSYADGSYGHIWFAKHYGMVQTRYLDAQGLQQSEFYATRVLSVP